MNDGLTKSQRYRLKDLAGYRARKAAYARTPVERAKRRVYMRKWKAANPERNRQYVRNRWVKHRTRLIPELRERYYMSRYGLTTAEATAMKKKPCGICRKHKHRMHIDHDHAIKLPGFRGVLCEHCNRHLGWFEHVGLHPILKYLKVV
jgi:hypothetical protein